MYAVKIEPEINDPAKGSSAPVVGVSATKGAPAGISFVATTVVALAFVTTTV